MKLIDLEPQFYRREVRIEKTERIVGDPLIWKPGDPVEEIIGPREYFVPVDTLAHAQGVDFLCPECFVKNGGSVGTHHVLCWFLNRNVPDDATPGPGRWMALGTGYHDLTLGPGSNGQSSVQLLGGGCKWHGYIVNGNITPA
jgi:hypothetical protein